MTGIDDRRGLRLLDWKPLSTGALLGRATVEIDGLIISDIGLFQRDGARWTQMPAEPMRDRDGRIIKDDRGKVRYRSPLKWKNRDLQERFSATLIAEIEAEYSLPGGHL